MRPKSKVSWTDSLNTVAANDETLPAVEASYSKTVVEEIRRQAQIEKAKALAVQELRIKLLEKELHLAKAKILDFEIQRLQAGGNL